MIVLLSSAPLLAAPLLGALLLARPAVVEAQRVDQDRPVLLAPNSDDLTVLAREVQAELEALSGKSFRRPVQVRVADTETLLGYARRRLIQMRGEARLAAEERAAKLLGMLPRETDLMATTFALLEEQVGGFYDPSADTFYVMEGIHPDLARLVMAHELTHALDDQLHDLDATDRARADNTDALIAHHAVIEGSAMAIMTRWALEHGPGLDREVLLEYQKSQQSQQLAQAPPFVWKPLIASYVQGEAFLRRRASLSSIGSPTRLEDRDTALASPPLSTEQVLHPVKYWDPERLDAPRTIEFETGDLPAGWTVSLEDTLGELGLALLVEPLESRKGIGSSPMDLLAARFTGPATAGWGGDRYLFAENGEAALVRLASVWDSERDAAEFAAAAEALRKELADTVDWGMDVQRLGKDRVDLIVWEGLATEAADEVASSLHVIVADAPGR